MANREGQDVEVQTNDCENCQLHKAKIVQLQKRVSSLKKKRAELYAEIEQVFASSNLRNSCLIWSDTGHIKS